MKIIKRGRIPKPPKYKWVQEAYIFKCPHCRSVLERDASEMWKNPWFNCPVCDNRIGEVEYDVVRCKRERIKRYAKRN